MGLPMSSIITSHRRRRLRRLSFIHKALTRAPTCLWVSAWLESLQPTVLCGAADGAQSRVEPCQRISLGQALFKLVCGCVCIRF